MTDRELMQQVLYAMEAIQAYLEVERKGLRIFDEAIEALRARLAQPEPKACWCETCRPITMGDMRMVLCPTCGNKRCPHATNHMNECTGSNQPGQKGSSYGGLAQPEPEPVACPKEPANIEELYTAPPQREWVGLTDEEVMLLVKKWHGSITLASAIEAKLKEKNAC